ncbi:MAG: ribonuclease III [Actinobacteria bacterium]|nr:ribonuclease III [Actinomycetota bacterium]
MTKLRGRSLGRRASALERRVGVRFRDKDLLKLALTHRSYAYEQGGLPTNERLEFLGDAVLGIVITESIYNEFPTLPEGSLAKMRAALVNMIVLADVAREIGLGESILLGRGEEMTGGRDKSSILADAFEALLGAYFLDRGIKAAQKMILDIFMPRIRGQVEGGTTIDYKTSLQEMAAAQLGSLPDYQISEAGPDHAKRFNATVYLRGTAFGTGEGRSKKEAEQAAAKIAVERLRTSEEPPPEQEPARR